MWATTETADFMTRHAESLNLPDRETGSDGYVIPTQANVNHYLTLIPNIERSLLYWGRISKPQNLQLFKDELEQNVPRLIEQFGGVSTPQQPQQQQQIDNQLNPDVIKRLMR